MNFKSLISENGRSISLGRLIFWLLTIALFVFWLSPIFVFVFSDCNKEKIDMIKLIFMVPDGLVVAWTTTMAYNLGKKLNIAKPQEIQ